MARIDDLTKYVSLRVDEYLEDATAASNVEIPFGDIPFELDEAVKWILRTISRDLLADFVKEPGSAPSLTVDLVGEKVIIPLPEDYLRFYSVQMNGWIRPVQTYYTDDSQQYQQQQFEYLRGTIERPMAFMVANPASGAKRDLEVYPDGEGTLKKLLYVPILKASDSSYTVTLFDDALVWKAAASVLHIMRLQGLSDRALAMAEKARDEVKTGRVGAS